MFWNDAWSSGNHTVSIKLKSSTQREVANENTAAQTDGSHCLL